MTNTTDVMIIGAGLAGLLAARKLAERGIRPVVLEKERQPGGRMTTHSIDGGLADVGAQFFTARTPEFQTLIDRWVDEGVVFEWSRGWSDGSLVHSGNGHPRYAARGGMQKLVDHLARGLDVRPKVNLVAVRRVDNAWEVEDENGTRQRARVVLLATPVPQSLALLDEGGVKLPEETARKLAAVTYEPCLTATFHIEGDITLPPPGVVQRPQAPVFWISDNQRKGISPSIRLVTLQASHAYSRQLFDEPDERVLRAFQIDLLPFMSDKAHIVKGEVSRWRYSQPMSIYPERCLVIDEGAPLVFAGDAFGAPRVEGAALSGVAAGEAVARLLGR